MTGERLERIGLVGQVVSEPRLVDGDWRFWLETFTGWYLVILKQGKRWLKPSITIRVAGFLRDDTLLADSCKKVEG